MKTTADVIFDKVENVYDLHHGITNLSFTIPGGSFFTLLGPSGCGKTTILRLIGGSLTPTKGKIFFGTQEVTDVPSHQRAVNTVFQNYALFPHLNVYENIAYGLRVKKKDSFEIKKTIDHYAELFGIAKYLEKAVTDLSGGQQQRVAIARAIVNNPMVLLLDEPLSAIDTQFKKQLLRELSQLQVQLGMTFVYVTHDQSEALAVSDYVAVMNNEGKICQLASPTDIYENPQSKFVAKFIGTNNTIDGFLHKKELQWYFVTDNGGTSFFYQDDDEKGKRVRPLKALQDEYDRKEGTLHIRPENILMGKEKSEVPPNCVEGKVTSMVYYGFAREYTVLTNVGYLKVLDLKGGNRLFDYESMVYVGWHPEHALFLES